jgi:hypothetical protein
MSIPTDPNFQRTHPKKEVTKHPKEEEWKK